MNPKALVGEAIRQADKVALSQALCSARADTLATFAAYQAALGEAPQVPQRGDLNPPLWELGHIGWFQAWWLARNPERALGAAANPNAVRTPAVRANADRLYNSSTVPHATRWALPLPDAAATRDQLAQQLQQSLALLQDAGNDEQALYFHRLSLLHEDMHHEAALYMARALEVPMADARWAASPLHTPRVELAFSAGTWRLGFEGAGFAFDNELGAHDVALPATRIDSRVLTWAEYLSAVSEGACPTPRYLRHHEGAWQERRNGHWQVLDTAQGACHLSLHEAEAWCRWAGRRLPSEAEWERAACTDERFEWGDVWEWTASPFTPYPGFEAHPYRDYSAPWFGTRQVLRGASCLTQPRMHHPRYRNFFTADRHDVCVGFRSCAL